MTGSDVTVCAFFTSCEQMARASADERLESVSQATTTRSTPASACAGVSAIVVVVPVNEMAATKDTRNKRFISPDARFDSGKALNLKVFLTMSNC